MVAAQQQARDAAAAQRPGPDVSFTKLGGRPDALTEAGAEIDTDAGMEQCGGVLLLLSVSELQAVAARVFDLHPRVFDAAELTARLQTAQMACADDTYRAPQGELLARKLSCQQLVAMYKAMQHTAPTCSLNRKAQLADAIVHA